MVLLGGGPPGPGTGGSAGTDSGGGSEWDQKVAAMLSEHVVDQILRAGWEHQARKTVDEHHSRPIDSDLRCRQRSRRASAQALP